MRTIFRKFVMPVIIGLYLLSAFSSLFFAGVRGNSEPAAAKPSAPMPSTAAPTELRPLYVLREDDGRIVVEDAATGKIIRRTDTLVSILPEDDRARLKKGISADTKGELRRLLEDFCS